MTFSERYPLPPFQSTDPEKLNAVMRRCPLATVISQQSRFPMVSQVPLVLSDNGKALRGHLDRNNPHCALIEKGGPIYCMFSGPNHYMSPSIYPDSQYPGWNYVAVHVEGTVIAHSDSAWLTDLLLQTADENEQVDSTYTLTPAQDRFESLLDYILGFEIEVSDRRGILKLAQDKGSHHAGVARDHLASVMRQDITEFLDEMLQVENE